MSDSYPDPVDALNSAIAIGHDELVSSPLDVIGLISDASEVDSPAREILWRRLFIEAPHPFWQIVSWARQLSNTQLVTLIEKTKTKDWNALNPEHQTITVDGVLQEVVARFDEFDPDLFPWEKRAKRSKSSPRSKYLLGRELARSYVQDQIASISETTDRKALLLRESAAWQEWIDINVAAGYEPNSICQATTIALDHIVSRRVTPGIDGIGRSHILLEQLNVNLKSTAAVVTASLLPIDRQHQHLDGIIVPDLRENGLIVISPKFLEGVSRIWQYAKSTLLTTEACLLCFSVKPKKANVLDELDGRSAELAILAAIESAIKRIVLRPDAAASATLDLDDLGQLKQDLFTGRANFEEKKFDVANRYNMSKVVVNSEVAKEWKMSNPDSANDKHQGEPDIVASEFYRRDALPVLETKSLWKLAYLVPGGITLAFVMLAVGFWQTYKMSASPIDADWIVPNAKLPMIPPALMASEMITLSLCFMMSLHCYQSIKRSLDSNRSACLALAVSSVIVLLSQYVPIGVRYEGLLDTPLYSILFGEPQITPVQVIEEGGLGFLLLHTASQTAGFITILFGVSAFAIRLILTRAHTEPIYEDRCELIKKDWRFSVSLMAMLVGVVLMFCLTRNVFWYFYLTTLPNIALIDNGGSLTVMVAPLLGISLVIITSVGIVWLYVLQKYLVNVVKLAQGRSGYTSSDVVATLPPMARLLYFVKPFD